MTPPRPTPTPVGPFAGAVLVGGASRRMGQPKALLRRSDGRTFLEAALDTLVAAGADPRYVCGELSSPPADAILLPDRLPGCGPLGGLEAALAASPHEWLLLVACDMPRLQPAELRGLLQRAIPASRAVVSVADGRLQPLCAAYHRQVLDSVRAALAERRLGLTRLVESWEPVRVSVSADLVLNLNTPAELERFREEERATNHEGPPSGRA